MLLRLRLGPFGGGFLSVVIVENDRAVLRAGVVALAIQCGRVMRVPEIFQQLLVSDNRGVVLDLDHLGVAGIAGADRFVSRVFLGAAGVTAGNGFYSRQLLEGSLHPQETPPANFWRG